MAGGKGFWRSVAGAFVEFDDAPARGMAAGDPSAAGVSVDETLASTEALLAQLGGPNRSHQAGSHQAAFAPEGSASQAGSPRPASTPPPAGSPAASVQEGRPFPELYAAAGLAPAQHSAEQMLAILDGLAALPPDACRVAIKAMDDADDKWTVADVLADARAKTEALVTYVNGLAASAQVAIEAAAGERASVDQMLGEAEAEIHKQIAALQAELDQFRADASGRRTDIDARIAAARDASARESSRAQAEIARLGRIASFLGPMVPANPLPR